MPIRSCSSITSSASPSGVGSIRVVGTYAICCGATYTGNRNGCSALERIASTKQELLPRFRRFTYRRTTQQTLLRQRQLETWMHSFTWNEISHRRIYPAVDPLASSSRIGPQYVGDRHYQIARQVEPFCSVTANCRILSQFLVSMN